MPAKSQSQQNFFRMVSAYKKGSLDTSKLSSDFVNKIKDAANMSDEQLGHYTKSTNNRKLPKHITENLSFIEYLTLDNF